MKRICRIILFCVVLIFVSSWSSSAQAMRFGTSERIEKIVEVEGTNFWISHKMSTYWFIAGVYVVDDGYVLQQEGQLDRYWEYDEEQVKAWQSGGQLPDPLPAYSIPFWDYVFGYSLWIVILVIGIWASFDVLKERLFPTSETSEPIVDPPAAEPTPSE